MFFQIYLYEAGCRKAFPVMLYQYNPLPCFYVNQFYSNHLSFTHCFRNLTDTTDNPCAFAGVVRCVTSFDCISLLSQYSNSRFLLSEPKISLSVFDIPQMLFCDFTDFFIWNIVQFFFDQFHTDFFCLR